MNDTTTLEIEVDSIKGEVFKYVRKNKLRSSFDLKISLKFTYKDAGKDVIRGTIVYEPFCDDEDPEDWDFEMKITNKSIYDAELMKDVERNVSRTWFYPRFSEW